MTTNFCPQCGIQLQPETKFCPNCGQAVGFTLQPPASNPKTAPTLLHTLLEKVNKLATPKQMIYTSALIVAIAVLLTLLFTVLEKDVYVAGYERNNQGNLVATLWKNGKPQRLSDERNGGEALSVYISGDDVYVAGCEMNNQGNLVATLWKNGVPKRLSDGRREGKANSVFVIGNDVYVAGYECIESSDVYSRAILWINEEKLYLKPTRHNWFDDLDRRVMKPNSVFVSGDDVFVVGQDNGRPTLWRNGTPQLLSKKETSSRADSVFVSGNDVYIAGCDNYGDRKIFPTIWKNGVSKPIYNDRGVAFSVYVSGKDVYVVGTDGFGWDHRTATVWKNDVPQFLTAKNIESAATSVTVSRKDVYVVGYEVNADGKDVATLWKNGRAKRLGNKSHNSRAYSIFVN